MKKAAFSTLCIFVALLPAACTWVNPTVAGGSVRVAYDGNVSGCREAGTVGVSVADRIGFYHRSAIEVRDELETMARNEAATLPADTIKPVSEPRDGEQRFEAYTCGRVQLRQRDANRERAPSTRDAVQTFPLREH